ncbi:MULTISPECIES: glutaminase A [unclassified Streptomyces]|uniref:glutaminase A n=1 Tax=unclassified Streptomyces TaxID=2593676 RepID=UPI000DADF5BD|nr:MULTISPECIES: glutaminase A [unclassified Streptomyces]PZT75919.1 glutaminase [Streptomyces sp. AC1-42W]PZT80130.1 glutaminase [Streptomyces sp. AC1-42T]
MAGVIHDTGDVADPGTARAAVSTGRLPTAEAVRATLDGVHRRFQGDRGGRVADYIPVLAEADPELFGIAVAHVGGSTYTAGDADHMFSIQSVSKPFVFALVNHELGRETVRQRIGVNSTGLPFNSVLAVELNHGSPMNPMVNAGALATTALVPGATPQERWDFVRRGLSRFAGRDLLVDDRVYTSEAATNQRNESIARLLDSYGALAGDPVTTTDLYTRQCSLTVSTRDLATMGATLANGGVCPRTGEQVVDAGVCRDTLSALATAGLYERSGDWLYEVGMPGKSGVSGGIITVAPGKGSLAVFSPRLDEAGNSVRGQRVAHFLSGALGMNLFASTAQNQPAVA